MAYGQPTQPPTSQRTWESMVRELEGPDYDRDRNHPYVYFFPSPAPPRRDKGGDSILYD